MIILYENQKGTNHLKLFGDEQKNENEYYTDEILKLCDEKKE